MKKEVFVLTEKDPEDGQVLIIGVCDSRKNADKLMLDYYKQFEVKKFRDVRDSEIEWYKDIELTAPGGSKYHCTCILQSFILNEA